MCPDKIKKEFARIKVFAIDGKKLSEKIDAEIREKIKNAPDHGSAPRIIDGESLTVHDFALARSASGKMFLVNKNCAHSECIEGNVEILVYSQIRSDDGKILLASGFPRFVLTASAEELIRDHGSETTMLDFIGDNFAMTDGIKKDMESFLDSIKK